MKHLTLDELQAGLDRIQASPADRGRLQSIVIRPQTNERIMRSECEISLAGGVHGDNWALGCWKSLPDGSPHPDVQIAIMNSRAIELIAQQPDRWALAGDNLFVDLDLSRDNLRPGQQLTVGSAVIEVTAEAHNGCRKFAQRFGEDAVRFVNSSNGKRLRLRGVYARVVSDGTIRVGNLVCKTS